MEEAVPSTEENAGKPFSWVCSCTHMAISHGTGRGVGSSGTAPLACRSCPGSVAALASGCQRRHLQQEPTWLVWSPFSSLWQGSCFALCVLRCSGFAVEPQSWSLLWGAWRAETWHRVLRADCSVRAETLTSVLITTVVSCLSSLFMPILPEEVF